jgi:hypothetical protein
MSQKNKFNSASPEWILKGQKRLVFRNYKVSVCYLQTKGSI